MLPVARTALLTETSPPLANYATACVRPQHVDYEHASSIALDHTTWGQQPSYHMWCHALPSARFIRVPSHRPRRASRPYRVTLANTMHKTVQRRNQTRYSLLSASGSPLPSLLASTERADLLPPLTTARHVFRNGCHTGPSQPWSSRYTSTAFLWSCYERS